MPKSTFFNIIEGKRNQLIQVGVELFSKHDFENIDVKMIVDYAQIPRGSFYAYFTDIEDYYSYIIEQLQTQRIKEIALLAKDFEKDFFEFLKFMYEYDIKKIQEKSRRLLLHHYFRYIQTKKKGSLSGTIYHLEKHNNVMSILLSLPIICDSGEELTKEEKIFIADLSMTIYLATYNKAVQEDLDLNGHLNLFKKRIKIIERGTKSC